MELRAVGSFSNLPPRPGMHRRRVCAPHPHPPPHPPPPPTPPLHSSQIPACCGSSPPWKKRARSWCVGACVWGWWWCVGAWWWWWVVGGGGGGGGSVFCLGEAREFIGSSPRAALPDAFPHSCIQHRSCSTDVCFACLPPSPPHAGVHHGGRVCLAVRPAGRRGRGAGRGRQLPAAGAGLGAPPAEAVW